MLKIVSFDRCLRHPAAVPEYFESIYHCKLFDFLVDFNVIQVIIHKLIKYFTTMFAFRSNLLLQGMCCTTDSVARTDRHKSSFVPQAIKLFNKDYNR